MTHTVAPWTTDVTDMRTDVDPHAAVEAEHEAPSSQFERLRDYIATQIGAVRRVREEQQSAELLVELAEDELGALKREFESSRLGVPSPASSR